MASSFARPVCTEATARNASLRYDRASGFSVLGSMKSSGTSPLPQLLHLMIHAQREDEAERLDQRARLGAVQRADEAGDVLHRVQGVSCRSMPLRGVRGSRS